MGEKRKIERLQRHVNTLQKQVERLTAENEALKNTNEALKLRISESDDVLNEFKEMLDRAREAKNAYSSALSELLKLKSDYIKDFNVQMKRIKKQK